VVGEIVHLNCVCLCFQKC